MSKDELFMKPIDVLELKELYEQKKGMNTRLMKERIENGVDMVFRKEPRVAPRGICRRQGSS